VHWWVKNLLELKNARRVTIDGNLFENCWDDQQSGEVALFTVRNQDGTAPWSTVDNVKFTNNLARHVGGGIALLGHDDIHQSQLAHDFVITNNAFFDVGGATWGGWGRFLTINSGTTQPGPSNMTIDRNLAMQAGDVIAAPTPGTIVDHPGLSYTNNITLYGGKGVWGPTTASGDPTLLGHFPTGVFTKNVLISGPAELYALHPGNFFPGSAAEVFVNAAAGDYRATGAYAGAGPDMTVLDAAAACRIVALP
jgi:hypothetical protein